ncbi:diguanylate cyclase [Paraburkholderia sp. MMS20-SJTR3]|uniref:diguanylate cyclase n=1 Tax=Paraburkholderia sejongensis TaxID=2886946 RepID=A0ABS8JZJ9_9BURK|nr:sensor domain-containing diguanylate cyclase [Paraburkholderia sp. MMS20-SJTR3]MCC8395333.1 diguanylate cyclase [Paraburkholderia sp. MMS20-SJTR3]
MFAPDGWWRTTRVGLVGLVAAFLLLVVSGQLKTMAGELVAIWITDGYLLGHMLLLRRRDKPIFLAGAFVGLLLANLIGDESFYVAFSFTLAGIVEICAAVLMLPAVKSARELVQPKVFVRFVVGACVIAPMLSGMVAVVLLQGIFTSHPFSSLSNWMISDALGFLIFTPVTLVMLSGEWRTLLERGNRVKSALILALIGVAAAIVFSQTSYGDLYWMLPPLALLAFHAELSTVLLGILLFICIAVPLTIHGTGPLWLSPFATMQDRVLALQLFTVAALSIVLPITVLQTQRNALLSALLDGQRRFRNLAERSEEVVMELSADGRFQYVSPRANAVLGYEPELLVGTSVLGLAHQDDRRELQRLLVHAGSMSAEQSVQYRVRRADGTHIWVRSFIAAMPSGVPGERAALAFTMRDIDVLVVAEQKRLADEQHLRDIAFVDSLTGLHNRRYLDDKVRELLRAPARGASPRPVAILFADVDYFKNYNDEYGHQAGDECLKIVGQCIATTIRSGDSLARYGGEEFVVLLEDCDPAEAVATAELIRGAVEALGLEHLGSPLGVVTLSIGVAQAQICRAVDAAQLFELADSGLYAAKRLGKNRVGRVQDGAGAPQAGSGEPGGPDPTPTRW